MNRITLYFLFLLPLSSVAQTTELSGFIFSETGALVNNVEVKLFDDKGQSIANTLTVNGKYTFASLPSGYDYTLQLSKAGNPLNGLSTYDYVLISRHLLAVEPLPDTNQVLAADVDGSGTVSVSDMLYLRQLILGIIPELPQQRNWLFIAEDQTPPNAQQLNTFTFELNSNPAAKNFVILKIGDLNRTADLD